MVDINQLTIRAKWDHRKTGGERLTRTSSKNCYWPTLSGFYQHCVVSWSGCNIFIIVVIFS